MSYKPFGWRKVDTVRLHLATRKRVRAKTRFSSHRAWLSHFEDFLSQQQDRIETSLGDTLAYILREKCQPMDREMIVRDCDCEVRR